MLNSRLDCAPAPSVRPIFVLTEQTLPAPLGLDTCTFNIKVNNKAGVGA